MDFNQLHHREGVERLRAQGTPCAEARRAHLALAGLYRDRIDGLRRARAAARPDLAAPAR